jgi:hypothetical protein
LLVECFCVRILALKIKLSDIAEVKTGYSQVAKSDLSIESEEDSTGTTAAVGLRSITNDGAIDLSRLDRVYTPQSEGWLRKVASSTVQPGDLIVAARGSSGKAGLVGPVPSEPLLCTNNVLLVRANTAVADASYLQAFIQNLYSDPTQEILRRGVLGQWSITRTDLEQLEIELPPLAEQKKISAAFSATHEARRAALAVSDHYGLLLEKLSSQYLRPKPRT